MCTPLNSIHTLLKAFSSSRTSAFSYQVEAMRDRLLAIEVHTRS